MDSERVLESMKTSVRVSKYMTAMYYVVCETCGDYHKKLSLSEDIATEMAITHTKQSNHETYVEKSQRFFVQPMVVTEETNATVGT